MARSGRRGFPDRNNSKYKLDSLKKIQETGRCGYSTHSYCPWEPGIKIYAGTRLHRTCWAVVGIRGCIESAMKTH